MTNVDPASPEFERLPKKEQAKIYYFSIGWDEPAIADELGIHADKLDRWLNEEVAHPRTVRARPSDRVHTPEDCERDYPEVCSLYRQGRSAREIIAETGVPQSTVYKVLKCRFGPLRQRDAA